MNSYQSDVIDDQTRRIYGTSARNDDREDEDAFDLKDESETKLDVVTKFVMFEPTFFKDSKRDVIPASFVRAEQRLSDEIKSSLRVEDFRAAIKLSLNPKPKVFDLLGTRRSISNEEQHSSEYRQLMSKRIIY